ncbi:hypothetical protein D3C72_2142230 [compost metagenome]
MASMFGAVAASCALTFAASTSMPHCAAMAGDRVFKLPTSMGDLFRCTLFTGRRVMPSGMASLRVNSRVRMVSASRLNSSRGS